jgi:hypothetical protein
LTIDSNPINIAGGFFNDDIPFIDDDINIQYSEPNSDDSLKSRYEGNNTIHWKIKSDYRTINL